METGKSAGEGGHAIRHLALDRHQGMLLQHQGLPRSSKLKGIVRPVERGIEAMNRPMVSPNLVRVNVRLSNYMDMSTSNKLKMFTID